MVPTIESKDKIPSSFLLGMTLLRAVLAVVDFKIGHVLIVFILYKPSKLHKIFI